MDRTEIQALIDRVIGKKGIMRAPSWWVRRLLGNLMDYTDGKAEEDKAYSEEMAGNAEKAAKKYADDNKVAKVDGKQLSTEDFTTALKQRLDGLINYDDTYVRSAITELQNDLDAIVNGDATSAIDSIQEILAFLSTITDTQTLAGIVADLKQYVDDKVAAGGGGSITLDSAMSDTSTNAVSNMVIKAYVDDAVSKVGAEVVNNLESESTTAALSANQGRVLAERIGDIDSILDSINGEVI